MPLLACAIMQFSFQHGICQEATAAFATFGTLKIFLAGDYAGGQYWASVARAMEKKHQSIIKSNMNMETHANLILVIAVDIWFQPPREVSRNLVTYHHNAMRTGQVHIAMAAFGMSCRYLLLGGENLSLLQQSYDDQIRLVVSNHAYIVMYNQLWPILFALVFCDLVFCFSSWMSAFLSSMEICPVFLLHEGQAQQFCGKTSGIG